MNRGVIRTALKDTTPVMSGYLFLGFGFGILMYQNGYGALWSLAMSLFIYAGSMQYVAVGLLTSKAGILTAALTTLLVNARHLFYGIAMIDTYKGAGKKKPYLIFSLTDETFSLVSNKQLPKEVNPYAYYFLVSILDQSYWVIGTLLGSLAGTMIPVSLDGIEFVLTALFVTIFVEQWLTSSNHIPAIVGLISTIICLLLFGQDIFLIPSMIAMTLLLAKIKTKGGNKR